MTRPIRTILIDDEPPARERLARLLSAHPEIEIIGQAADIPSALTLCQLLHPHLLFLDIRLGAANGFDLLPLLDHSPSVIFVTAFENFALQAFEINALDYLLKPISPERLAAAISRLPASITDGKPIPLQEDRGLRLVPADAITHIRAEDNYTMVHLLTGPPALVRKPLSDWQNLLPPPEFLRLGRSLLIRLSAVSSIRSQSRELTLLTLAGTHPPLRLGRRASLTLRRALS